MNNNVKNNNINLSNKNTKLITKRLPSLQEIPDEKLFDNDGTHGNILYIPIHSNQL